MRVLHLSVLNIFEILT